MKKKPTNHERLIRRKLHKPPFIIYQLLVHLVIKLFLMRKLNIRFFRNFDHRTIKGPYIIVGNHASRLDYIYASVAFLPHSINYVAAYNEFYRAHLNFIFRLMQVIPKKNFLSDSYAIKSMRRILDDGGRVIVFPEGMSSISGTNQPSAIASGKMLKHFKLPVLSLHISGGYLTSTKYCLDQRPGRVDVVVDKLFSPEELEQMSCEEIQTRLDEAIAQDDYEWNKKERVAFDGHGALATQMHTLLYWCPKCGAEFTMRGEGDVISCTACGNGARLNACYDLVPLDESCVIPANPRIWFDMERDNERRFIADDGFELREHVKLGTLPEYGLMEDQKTSIVTGEGELWLNRQGLHFSGTKNGAPFAFDIGAELLPTYGMATDTSRFYTFHHEGEYLEFWPERESVGKWLLATEENHRYVGGAWKDFPPAYYEKKYGRDYEEEYKNG